MRRARARPKVRNYVWRSRTQNHRPGAASEIFPEHDVFAALDGDDEVSGRGELDALVSEVPALTADRSGRNPAAGREWT